MSRLIRASALVVALIASGCGQQAVKVIPAPKVVHDTVYVYTPVPAYLTTQFMIPERASNKVIDVVDAYNQRGDTLRQCNARLEQIKDLGAQP